MCASKNRAFSCTFRRTTLILEISDCRLFWTLLFLRFKQISKIYLGKYDLNRLPAHSFASSHYAHTAFSVYLFVSSLALSFVVLTHENHCTVFYIAILCRVFAPFLCAAIRVES